MRGIYVFLAILLMASLSVGKAQSADTENKYVGDDATNCAMCHKDAVAAWKKWPMAGAWDKLKPAEQKNASCVVCHTTGYGKPGGFVSVDKTPKLTGVQCEACHGPAGDHMKVPLSDKAKKKATMKVPTEATCTACHKKEGNPNFKPFDFKEQVKKLEDHKPKAK